MAVRAVIFDYKTLLRPPGATTAEAARLLQELTARGLDWCLFTTNPLSDDQERQIHDLGYPAPALTIDQRHIASGKKRGSPDWIDAVTGPLALQRHELLYIGATNRDWRTAINAGVMYQHARWTGPLPPGTTSLVAQEPQDVTHFLTTYLEDDPHWSHRLDQDNWSLRSLLPASAVLPSTSPHSTFKLQDVFTYDKKVKIGESDARSVLMLFVIANAYLEGLVPSTPYFCVYPSSKKGRVSEQLQTYLERAAKLFHGYYREDLLIRAEDAPDTSLERWRASQGRSAKPVSIATQAQTVHLGPKYEGKLGTKTIVVLDDFTTKGISLEWARLLLTAAGARRIVMLTVGKYGSQHSRYALDAPETLHPFRLNSLSDQDFTATPLHPDQDPQAVGWLSQRIGDALGTDE